MVSRTISPSRSGSRTSDGVPAVHSAAGITSVMTTKTPEKHSETKASVSKLELFIRESVCALVDEWVPDDGFTLICDDTNNSKQDTENGVVNVTIVVPVSRLGWVLREEEEADGSKGKPV